MNNNGSEVGGQGAGMVIVPRFRIQTAHSSPLTSHRSRGFTLLEVLIAVAIMAGIVTVIYASFFTTSQNVEQAEKIRDASDLARTLVAKLTNDIANAYVNPGMNSSNAPLTVFYGKKVQPETGDNKPRYDELYLTTQTNWRTPGTKETDLWEVGYYFKQKPDSPGYVMMRREKRELSKDVPALEGGVEYEMTDRVESLQFRYYSGSTWSDEWNNRTTLPLAVQISLLFDNGSTYQTKVDIGR